MDLNSLTIGQAREIAALIGNVGASKPAEALVSTPGNDRPVIIRSRDAGVQFGYLDRFEGSTVYLKKARQMWSWTAAEGGTLLDCATHGVKAGKFSTVAESITIFNACSIIPCTDKAVKTLEDAKWA